MGGGTGGGLRELRLPPGRRRCRGPGCSLPGGLVNGEGPRDVPPVPSAGTGGPHQVEIPGVLGRLAQPGRHGLLPALSDAGQEGELVVEKK